MPSKSKQTYATLVNISQLGSLLHQLSAAVLQQQHRWLELPSCVIAATGWTFLFLQLRSPVCAHCGRP